MFPMNDKPLEPRKLTHGAPTARHKKVIVFVTKEKDDDKLGCYLEAFETDTHTNALECAAAGFVGRRSVVEQLHAHVVEL